MSEVMTEERLSSLIDTYGDRILRIGYLYLNDRLLAEDICQEVYIKLYHENKVFNEPEHEKAWIFRVAINLCKNQRKSSWMKRIVLGEAKEVTCKDMDIAEGYEEKEERGLIFQQVLSLSNAFKDVVVLYYYEDYSTGQIAEILSIPEGTVRSRLDRARKKLKIGLEGGIFNESGA